LPLKTPSVSPGPLKVLPSPVEASIHTPSVSPGGSPRQVTNYTQNIDININFGGPAAPAPKPPVRRTEDVKLKSVEGELAKFSELIKQWSSGSYLQSDGDSRMAMLSAGNYLQEYAKDFLGDDFDRFQSKVCIVGDQSAGKTTLCTRLLSCCCMLMDPDTATKVRTRVQYRWNPVQDEDYLCSMKQEKNGLDFKELSMADLFARHKSVFKEKYEQPAAGPGEVCDINIDAKKSALSLNIIDHPGFVIQAQAETFSLFGETMTEIQDAPYMSVVYVANALHAQQPTATGLAAIAHGKLAQYNVPSTRLNDLPKGKIFLAISMANKLNYDTLFGSDCNLSLAFSGKVDKTSGVCNISGLDIAKYIIRRLKKPVESKNDVLPGHTQVFFIGGFGGTQASLEAATDPFREFDEGPQGASVNDAKLKKVFTDPKLWDKHDEPKLKLKDLTQAEEDELDAMLGFDKMQSALLETQQSAYEAILDEIMSKKMKVITGQADLAKQAFIQRKKDFKNFRNLNSVSSQFLDTFNELYCNTAGPAEVFTPDHSNPDSSRRWREIQRIWSSFSSKGDDECDSGELSSWRPECPMGWTLGDDKLVWENCMSAPKDAEPWLSFPPPANRICNPRQFNVDSYDLVHLSGLYTLDESTGTTKYFHEDDGSKVMDFEDGTWKLKCNEDVQFEWKDGGYYLGESMIWKAVNGNEKGKKPKECQVRKASKDHGDVDKFEEWFDNMENGRIIEEEKLTQKDAIVSNMENGIEQPLPKEDCIGLIHNSKTQLRTLSTLMHRFRTEFAIRSQAIKVHNVDKDALLAQAKQSVQVAMVDLKETVAAHVGNLLTNIYDVGNPFVAKRAAMACMQHAQTVLTALLSLDEFKGLNLEGDVNLLEQITAFSSILSPSHPANDLEPDCIVKATELKFTDMCMEMFKQCQAESSEHDGESAMTDLVHVIVAHYFDSIHSEMLSDLEAHTRKMLLSLPVYYPSSMHLGAMFMHQDDRFLAEYQMNFPFQSSATAVTTESQPDTEKTNASTTDMAEFVTKFKVKMDNLKERTIQEFLDGAPLYSTPEDHPDDKVSDKVLFDLALRFLKSPTETERAKLVSQLMDQNSGPDVVAPITLTSRLNDFQLDSINYVVKRYMASAIKKTTDEVLLNCTSLTYKFMHPVAISKNQADLNERHMSLLMGYPYPYTVRQQPRCQRHLSLDVVIPFLYHRKKELRILAEKFKGKNSKADGQTDVEEEKVSDRSNWGTSQEKLAYQSRIVQGIFTLISEKNDPASTYISSLDKGISCVTSWFMKWEQADRDNDDTLRASLIMDIKSFLLEMRYRRQDKRKEALKAEIQQFKECADQWEATAQSLVNFREFVKKHSKDLAGNASLDDEQKCLKPKQINVEFGVTVNVGGEAPLAKPPMPKLSMHFKSKKNVQVR